MDIGHLHYKTHNECTGLVATCTYSGSHDIPDLMSTIACPPPLVDQWLEQAHRFLMPGLWSIMPHLSAREDQRKVLFSEHVHNSSSDFNNVDRRYQILVVSTSVSAQCFL